jgi:polysaccharide pyruvyl transferase CsaB
MTKYVISGYIGFDNFGDEAIAKVLTSYLKNNGAEKITVLSSNPHKTAALYDVQAHHFLKFLPPIFQTDVLISGGGSLLQDITSLKSLIYYLIIIATALIFKKRVVIFAQGFTPFRTKLGKFLTSIILKHCHSIYVRDEKSKEILEEIGINSILVADPVFGIEAKPQNHNGIGVQLRDFPSLNENFLNKLAHSINKNFPNKTIKLISLQDSIDLPVLEKFAKKLENFGNKTEIYKNLSIDNALTSITELEYLIAMRFHASLVAVKAGVKVLGINYDIKVSSLSNSVGFPSIELNQESIEKEFNEFINIDTSKYTIPTFNFPEI